jgi:hypothetical protein
VVRQHLWKVVAEDHDRCQSCGVVRCVQRTRFDTIIYFLHWHPGEKAVRPSNGSEPKCDARYRLKDYGPQPLLEKLKAMTA